MSVMILGMEMPQKENGAVLIIYPDGRCAFEDGSEYKAVPVPPHGRLIDAGVFEREVNESVFLTQAFKDAFNLRLQMQSAVIEAEEGET